MIIPFLFLFIYIFLSFILSTPLSSCETFVVQPVLVPHPAKLPSHLPFLLLSFFRGTTCYFMCRGCVCVCVFVCVCVCLDAFVYTIPKFVLPIVLLFAACLCLSMLIFLWCHVFCPTCAYVRSLVFFFQCNNMKGLTQHQNTLNINSSIRFINLVNYKQTRLMD